MHNSEIINSKIYRSAKELTYLINDRKSDNEKIIFTNGCFDVLHFGHIDYLSRAADLGSKLIVGLNTDASVKRLKGNDRPVNNQEARAKLLAALFFVDAICFFDQDTPIDLINIIKPDILVKGSDYKAEKIVGYSEVIEYGGSVVTLDFVEGFSSSDIIEKMNRK